MFSCGARFVRITYSCLFIACFACVVWLLVWSLVLCLLLRLLLCLGWICLGGGCGVCGFCLILCLAGICGCELVCWWSFTVC